MKKCPYCGQTYSDEYSVCSIDENPLESCDPKPPTPSSDSKVENVESNATVDEQDGDSEAPDGFFCLGKFDITEAHRLLSSFTEAGIRFQIDKIEGRVFSAGGMWHGPGYRNATSIEIFVHKDDEQRATKILTADWKV